MKSKLKRDTLYAAALQDIVDFRFDESVAGVFPDMIQRSVPGYSTIIAMTGVLAAEYARPDTNCYDLGCSVGATTLAMRSRIQQPGCRIIAADNSNAMIRQCERNLSAQSTDLPVDLLCADIRDITLENASVVVLNFTLQFIPPEQRAVLVAGIYRGMNDGAVLILSEKISFADKQTETRMTELHHVFKRGNGYSDLEISQKRAALEKVLIPETVADHRARLNRAGFSSAAVWFRCFNFMSLFAVK